MRREQSKFQLYSKIILSEKRAAGSTFSKKKLKKSFKKRSGPDFRNEKFGLFLRKNCAKPCSGSKNQLFVNHI